MSRITIGEARDRNIWEGWFKEAKECSLENESLAKFLDHLKNDYLHDYGTSARATGRARMFASMSRATVYAIYGNLARKEAQT